MVDIATVFVDWLDAGLFAQLAQGGGGGGDGGADEAQTGSGGGVGAGGCGCVPTCVG